MGSVKVVLVRDALSQHLRVYHTPARLRAAPEQSLQGQMRESGLSHLPPNPAGHLSSSPVSLPLRHFWDPMGC